MWVSSSAFEKLLDSSKFSIIAMAYRLDPKGEYVKRYIPELRNYPREFIHEPWKTPISSQNGFDCISANVIHCQLSILTMLWS